MSFGVLQDFAPVYPENGRLKITVACRCISANETHFAISIELDIRYFAIRFTVFRYSIYGNATAVTAGSDHTQVSVRATAQTETWVSRFGEHSTAAQTKTWVSVSAVPLHRPKPGYR